MLENDEYIRQSLQIALISTKLVYEHIIFLEITAPDFAPLLQTEKKECEKILNLTLDIADGKVEQSFIDFNALVTNSTQELEKRTSKIFRVHIDDNITTKSLKLKSGKIYVTEQLLLITDKINKAIINLFKKNIDRLHKLKKGIQENKYDIYCSIDFIDHYIKETELLLYNIETIKWYSKGSPTHAYHNEYYYNHTMKEHCQFLDENYALFNLNVINDNQQFLKEFDNMMLEFNNEVNPYSIANLNLKTTLIVERFKHFEEDIVNKMMDKNFFETIIPLYYDHLLREANTILYNLKFLKN